MKPSKDELELVFLHDLDRRVSSIEQCIAEGRPVKSWVVGGLRNALNSRIAEVQQRKEQQCQDSEASQR